MKKKFKIVLTLMIALFVGCADFDCTVFGECPTSPTVPRILVFIADGTSSTTQTYAIPPCTVDHLKAHADSLYRNDGGTILITKIDRDNRNNPFVRLDIPQHSLVVRPQKYGYETPAEYAERVNETHESVAQAVRDSTRVVAQYTQSLSIFLTEASLFLAGVYNQSNSRDNSESDVIGTLNNVFKDIDNELLSYKNTPNTQCKVTIIAFSDLAHWQRNKNQPQVILNTPPKGVQILAVNPAIADKVTNKAVQGVIVLPTEKDVFRQIYKKWPPQY